MRHLLSASGALGAVLALSSIAGAQSVFIPVGAQTLEGPSSTGYPWNRNASAIRVQYLYDSTIFTSQGIATPIRIVGARWRANAAAVTTTWAGTTYSNVTIGLSTAAVNYAAPSTTFASNRGVDYTTVHSGAVTVAPGTGNGTGIPAPWYVTVNFGTPFLYDPTTGNDFLSEFAFPAGSWSGGSTTAVDCFTTNSLTSRIYDLNGGNTTGTTQQNVGITTELIYTPAAGLYPNFTATPTSGPSPLNVQFTDATFTSDPGGVTSWAWDLDGDTLIDSNAQNPAFVYNTCGRYNVSLTVTDASNPQASTTKNQFITVDPQLLVTASFTVSSTGPLTRQFTDTSTGSPSVWSWDFDGDNIPDSAVQNPSFTYASGGTYAVTLNASNACGAGVSTRQIVVIANDDCVGAIPAVAGTNGPFSNVGASSSASFNCGGTTDSDLWFSYTPSCNVAVEINTCATSPSFDTKISVHSGTCGALTQLACNDDAGAGCGVSTLLSRVTGVPMTGGQTYYIAIGGFNGATGTFVFDILSTATGAGSFTTVSPGCGGTGLVAAGNPNIGGSANFTMAPVSGLPFINLGIIPLGVPICAGGCVLGATLDATYPGATFGGPIPCDPLLIGATIYTQGIDLGAAGGCAAGDPIQLTLSDTVRTIIG
jgi:PKD repeat protein